MSTLDPKLDGERLGKQLADVCNFMLKSVNGFGESWWTLREIEICMGHKHPQASISARLRQLRSMGYTVERRRRGEPKSGCWEYRVVAAEEFRLTA